MLAMVIYFENRGYLSENGLISRLSHNLINFLKMRLDGIIINAEGEKNASVKWKEVKMQSLIRIYLPVRKNEIDIYQLK